MIRVPVPIDLATIANTGSSAFAFATPLRVDRILVLAVSQALGTRAPDDKRQRAIRTTLDGFRRGRFLVHIDGRIFERADAVVVCAGAVTLRFFSTEPTQRTLPAR